MGRHRHATTMQVFDEREFSEEWAAGQLPASLRLFFLSLMQFFVVVRWFVTCRHKRNNFQSLTCRHSAWKPSDNHGVFGLSSVS